MTMPKLSPAAIAGRRLWIGFEGTALTSTVARHLENIRPGGVILFSRNISSVEQVAALTSALRELLGPTLHIAIDQEGGAVVRVTDGLTVFPGNMALGAIAARDLEHAATLAFEQGLTSGRELREIGIDVNLAPCVDVLSATGRNLGTRSFGDDFGIVLQLGAAVLCGHYRAGVLGCPKHFPGLGDTRADPHVELPVVEDPKLASYGAGLFSKLVELRECQLVMSSHFISPWDGRQPATYSKSICIELLRGNMAFEGVLISDDLRMAALRSAAVQRNEDGEDRFTDRVMRAANAGHDVLLVCTGIEEQIAARDMLESWHVQDNPGLGDAKTIAARLDRLRIRSDDVVSPDIEPTVLAAQIAEDATHVLADPRGLLARLSESQPFVLLPAANGADDERCDPLRGESLEYLRDVIVANTRDAQVQYYSERDVVDLTTVDRGYSDLLIVGIIGVDGSVATLARAQYLSEVMASYERVVALLFGDPDEWRHLTGAQNATRIAVYGYRNVHQHALIRTLFPLASSP